MTSDMLISEGRRLARPCVFLRPEGDGPVAATWHERDDDEIEETGFRCWITVDSQFVPGLPKEMKGYFTLYTDERKCKGGRIEFEATPQRPGTELYASHESVLPPIDAVFMQGSAAVGEWLAANDWPREERYNDNFRDSDLVDKYEQQWFKEYPLYREDNIYAVLGGWHFPGADDDWYGLIDEQLLVLTIHDSEPWVEGWRLRSGQFDVIQRIS